MFDLNFLIVDDDSITTHLLEKIISCKYKTTNIDIFKNPENALLNLERRKYDLIISDICMEPIDGFEFYKKAKKIDDNNKIVLMSSSVDNPEFKHIARELGTEIIPKPLDCMIVLKYLRKYVPLPESS